MTSISTGEPGTTGAPGHHGDALLVARLEIAKKPSFLALYERHHRAVYLYCVSILRSGTEAEEASQDTWMALWKARPGSIAVSDSLLPWLLVTARHKSLDRYRALARHQAAELTEWIAVDGEDDTLVAIEAAELERFIDRTIAGMPGIDRQLYELCIVQSVSYADAAERLGLGPSAVRNRIHRLRARLRTQLASFGAPHENS